MSTKFQIKRSSVQGKAPTTSNIDTGELAINVRDNKLFSSDGSVTFEVGANLDSLHVGAGGINISNGGLITENGRRLVDNTYFTAIEAELKVEAAQQAANATANAIAFATAGGLQYLQVANAVPLIQNNTVKYLETANANIYLEKANASIYMEKANTTVFMEVANLATVATSGSYNDLNDQPTIPSVTPYLEVANVSSYGFTSNTYAASNTYVNTQDNAILANVNPRIINVRGIANDANTKAVQALADAAAANTRAESARTLAVSANSNLNSYKANVNPRIISVVGTAATANTKAVQALADAAAANTRAEAARTLAVSANSNLNSYKANVNPRIISVVSTAGTANTKAVQALADAAAANTRAEGARTLAVSANSNLNSYKANVNLRIISVATTAATANTKAVQALADAAAANTRAEGARTLAVAANTRAEGARTLAVSANSNLNAYKANTNPRFNLYMAVANLATVATSGAYSDLSGTPPATSIAMYKYFPSTNTSTFTGNDSDSNSLNYTNTNVEVYLNGLKLIKNNDFRAPNSTHLTLYANAVNGDSVQIVSYQAPVGSVSGLNNLSDVANTGFSNAEILIYDGTNFKSSANNNQGVRIGGIGISSYGSGFFFLRHNSGNPWNRAGSGSYNVIMNPGQATPPAGQAIVAIGYEAGNSIGSGSVAIGKYAGYNQTGQRSVFIGELSGYSSGSGSGNVGVGRSALQRVTGSSNVGIGRGAGAKITSSSDNTVVGTYAIAQGAGCTGNKNVAIGKYSLAYHTSGTHTVAVGYEAGYYSYGMSKSVLLGSFAGGSASGNNNICIGYKSGKTGGNLSNGQKNTIIGSDTGGITTGNNNVVLGASATASATGVTNEITLGDSNISTIRAQVTSITALSDERDKTNIIDIPVGLDFVEEMRPVKFDWNRRDGSKQGEGQVGFIAQDLQSLERDYGVEQYTQLVYNSNPERLEATPLNAFPIIVKAIQELSEKIDNLQQQINDMQGQSDE